MNDKRSLFAATVFDKKYVYVYGGTSKVEKNFNVMPKNICEKYDATKNEWSIIHIENALNLSGFGWCET
jgi:hypothetical protein